MQSVKPITKKEATVKVQMKKVITRWLTQVQYLRVATGEMWTNVVSLKVKRTHWKFTLEVTHLTMKVTIKADNKKNIMKGANIILNEKMIMPVKVNANTMANRKMIRSLGVRADMEAMADVDKSELTVEKKNVVNEEKPITNSSNCVQIEKNFRKHSAN
jgi:hypothetical protein